MGGIRCRSELEQHSVNYPGLMLQHLYGAWSAVEIEEYIEVLPCLLLRLDLKLKIVYIWSGMVRGC